MIVIKHSISPKYQLDVEVEWGFHSIPARSIVRVKLDKPSEYQSGCIVYVTADVTLAFDFQTADDAMAFYVQVRDLI